jgi:2-polyprenyl-3-methyl-5-hydroxy-6-metoxy-1,4-benzoquinol methylase
MKILVGIANFGTAHDQYLSRMLQEYRGMQHDVDIVVTSNIAKDLGPQVEVVTGLPTKNPWSLGFAHKRIFAERAANYDLFIYSEDDVLITQRNIEAFMRMTDVLPKNEIASFFRTEMDSAGRLYFSDSQFHYHWDASTFCQRGEYTFASFTNEHAACYALTREQLGRAIASGGFSVEPHEGKYDLLCAAATDPYTQCGFKKLICISHFEDFLVPHLPNKYGGKGPLPADELYMQLKALVAVSSNGKPKTTLFPVETKLFHDEGSKGFYEPCQDRLIDLVPKGTQTLLSVGCGWGVTEKRLMEKGIRVKAVPIDSVIAACAEGRGVEVVYGDLKAVREKLAHERFDCVLMSNVLHLVRDPVEFLAPFIELLAPDGCVVASVPNWSWFRRYSRQIRVRGHHAVPRSYDVSGMHPTTGRMLRRWFRQAGLKPKSISYEILDAKKRVDGLSLGLAKPILGANVYLSGVRAEHDS